MIIILDAPDKSNRFPKLFATLTGKGLTEKMRARIMDLRINHNEWSLLMEQTVAQIFSIAAMALAILSFQCKNNRKFCLVQALSAAFFVLSFFMLGGGTGAISNAVNIARGLAFGLLPPKYRNLSLALLLPLYAVGTYFTYAGFFSILLLSAQLVGTVSIWHNDGKIMRIIQFFWICPVWLAYSIYYFSLGGILCECITMVSVVVSVIRYGPNGFTR